MFSKLDALVYNKFANSHLHLEGSDYEAHPLSVAYSDIVMFSSELDVTKDYLAIPDRDSLHVLSVARNLAITKLGTRYRRRINETLTRNTHKLVFKTHLILFDLGL